ncbi:MAG: Ezrin/radixin/moesin family protein [Ekhidna sp.]|nr:Ezrin/radixin/moesin family protein [Ekhidna sp.]
MKKSIVLIVMTLCSGVAFNAAAQMSKKEAKEWKKRIKKLQPEQYKRLLDEHKSLKGQVNSLKAEINNVDDRTAEKDQQIATYQQQVSNLREELGQAQAQLKAQNVASNNTGGGIDESRGVVFKVQLGAFRQKDLQQYDTSSNFSAENEDGLQKYTIGVFKDYYQADKFKKYLREMGVKDAWVVSYRDGQRVPTREVLESIR